MGVKFTAGMLKRDSNKTEIGLKQQVLSEQLNLRRRARFTGRRIEIAQFMELLDPDMPLAVLYVHGLGGVGKSCLLNHCAELAAEQGHACLRLDARQIPAEPRGIEGVLGLDQDQASNGTTLADFDLLLIDSLEYWRSLEAWLADSLLPRLPARLRIVLAGRHPPAADWRLDPGWCELMSVVELGNFRRGEILDYLMTRGLDDAWLDTVIQSTRGYPLGMAMMADQLNQGQDLNPIKSLEMTRELVARLVSGQQSPAQRQALYASAVAAELSEATLARLLPGEDAGALFDWLGSLSCMLPGDSGLYPHDLVRDYLLDELRLRQPGRYEYFAGALFELEVTAALGDAAMSWQEAATRATRGLYALRHVAALEGLLTVETGDRLYLDQASGFEIPEIEARINHFESADSVAIFRHWIELQPQGLLVFRDAARRMIGFCFNLELSAIDAGQLGRDPVAERLWQRICEQTSPGPGDAMMCTRYWMHCEQYQQSGLVAMMALSLCAGHVVTSPDQIIQALVSHSPNPAWQAFARMAGIDHSPHNRAELGGQWFEFIYSDWRKVDRIEWVRQFARQVTGGRYRGLAIGGPAAVDLAPTDFDKAFKQLLNDLHDSHALASNPLLDCFRSDPGRGGDASAVQALRKTMRQLIAGLGENARTERHGRVLERAYLKPVASQQLAADSLNLAYSTYRRLLASSRQMLAAEFCARFHLSRN